MEIGDTSEEAVNIKLQPSENEGTEPAENTENAEKLGNTIQFNCDQCNRKTLLKRG